MNPRRKVNVGMVFSRLTVVGLISDPKNPKAICICSCGAKCTPQCGALMNGRAKSCGCLGRENQRAAVVKHGMSKTPEYKVFSKILDRCNNQKNGAYHNYGGRGIKCLFPSFEAFIAEVGKRPPGAWIERLDNDGPYGPGNCAWVTPKENQGNKRTSKTWIIDGVEYASSKDAGAALGVHYSTIVHGVNGRDGKPGRLGWSSRLKNKEQS